MACSAPEYCTDVGNYTDGAGNGQGLLMEGNGLYWPRAVEAALPGGLVTATRVRGREWSARGRPYKTNSAAQNASERR